ncbi:CPBP family intramembrane glutamic endopeptidase [Streptococcus ratti]|uniref:CPBP family intramembrane metalloprotease n=1 Tax=Streptococcus ratti TaxID=1341 RepID=A0A7X9LEH6_STRRT|nr:type II CAAX endopeptidase family protein [Streptococcus ratti]NMD49517.1 CPBP family intramembrane metalloprotease [Streptococcus ratti]
MKGILKKAAAAVAIAGLFVVSQVPDLVMIIWKRESSVLNVWQTLTIVIMQVLVIAGFYVLARRKELLSSGIKHWLSWKTFAVVSLGFIALFIVKLIGGIILTIEGKTTTNNQATIDQLFENSSLLLMFIFIVIVAPLTEEIIFRGLIPKLFSKRFEGLGFALGALLFGLLHGPSDIGSFVLYVGMGAVLAIVCYRFKHLEYSIWIHGLNNALGFVAILVTNMMSQ